MNPEQYERWMQDHWTEIMTAVITRTYEVIKLGFNQMIKEVREAAQIICNSIDEMSAEARAIVTHNMQEGEKDAGKDDTDS